MMRSTRILVLAVGLIGMRADASTGTVDQILDRNLQVVLKPTYTGYMSGRGPLFHEGLCAVSNDKPKRQFGFINTKGELVIPLQFDWAKDFSEGLAACCGKDGWGFIDNTGKFVLAANHKFFDAESFHEGLAKVGNKHFKDGYIDKSGNVIIPFQFKYAGNFSDGVASVSDGSKYGLIDKTGAYILKPKYENISDFKNGLAAVKLDKTHRGFIDSQGREVVPAIYEDCGDYFCDGLLVVKLNGKWGAIDSTGKFVIEARYAMLITSAAAAGPSQGLLFADLNEKRGLIDTAGKTIIEPKYSRMGKFTDGIAQVAIGNKFGMVDLTGREVVPVIYDECDYMFHNGYVRVTLNGKKVYVDKEGKQHEPSEIETALGNNNQH